MEVVGLFPGGELAPSTRAIPQDLPDRLEVMRAAELIRVERELLEQPLRELGRRHGAPRTEVDELALHSADRGAHLVVVDQL